MGMLLVADVLWHCLMARKKCRVVCQTTALGAGREPVLYQQEKTFLHYQRVETSPIMFSFHVLSWVELPQSSQNQKPQSYAPQAFSWPVPDMQIGWQYHHSSCYLKCLPPGKLKVKKSQNTWRDEYRRHLPVICWPWIACCQGYNQVCLLYKKITELTSLQLVHTEQWRAAPLPGLKAKGIVFSARIPAFLKDMPEPCCQGAAGAGLFPDEAKEKGPHGSSARAQLLQNMARTNWRWVWFWIGSNDYFENTILLKGINKALRWHFSLG